MDKNGFMDGENLITGPIPLTNGSIILEFFEPHEFRNASVLMRVTVKHTHSLTRLGKKHPWVKAPPLHLHFDQSETFQIISGQVGTTTGWQIEDRIWTASDGAQEIKPWVPHRFWPVPECDQDTVLLLWAHPSAVAEPMDRLFFENLLRYTSDVYEGKVSMDPLQLMLLQHVSATSLVLLPSLTIFGPLRWALPWALQWVLASIASMLGYMPLMKEYTSKDDIQGYRKSKVK